MKEVPFIDIRQVQTEVPAAVQEILAEYRQRFPGWVRRQIEGKDRDFLKRAKTAGAIMYIPRLATDPREFPSDPDALLRFYREYYANVTAGSIESKDPQFCAALKRNGLWELINVKKKLPYQLQDQVAVLLGQKKFAAEVRGYLREVDEHRYLPFLETLLFSAAQARVRGQDVKEHVQTTFRTMLLAAERAQALREKREEEITPPRVQRRPGQKLGYLTATDEPNNYPPEPDEGSPEAFVG